MLNKVAMTTLAVLFAGPLFAQQSEEPPEPESAAQARLEELTPEEREKLIKECEARLEKIRNEENVQDADLDKDDPCEDLAIEASTEEFIPSEDISADNSISFPVDI